LRYRTVLQSVDPQTTQVSIIGRNYGAGHCSVGPYAAQPIGPWRTVNITKANDRQTKLTVLPVIELIDDVFVLDYFVIGTAEW